MGHLREKLDDDLPELTEGLVSMLWPHYLRTIPSMMDDTYEKISGASGSATDGKKSS